MGNKLRKSLPTLSIFAHLVGTKKGLLFFLEEMLAGE